MSSVPVFIRSLKRAAVAAEDARLWQGAAASLKSRLLTCS